MLKRDAGIVLLVIFVGLCVLLPACGANRRPAPGGEYQYRQQGTQQGNDRPARDASQAGSIAKAVEKVNPSVVGISTVHVQRDSLLDNREALEGVGTGFIVHPDGYIITNDHVAGNDPDDITVILHNGDELEGKVLWTDPTLDLAVVKVNGSNLPAAELGESEELVVGEPAIAIGTPLGLQFQHTTTAGVISALNRTVQVPTEIGENFMEDLIQTDASINPGNSGGPLVNIDGQVIGINTVKVVSAEGIGFAIPIDVAKPIIEHFINEGEFVTPYIGIVGFDRDIASFYKRDGNIREGVYVIDIDTRGPAFKSGIRVDDIITRVGDRQVSKMLELRTAVYSHKVGDAISITVIRSGRERVFEMTLEPKSRT